MIRQFRIDRFNGQEILVCEVYRRHTFTQLEEDALFKFREREREFRHDPEFSASVYDFRRALSDFLEQKENYDDNGNLLRTFFGLSEPVAVYDSLPAVIIRGVVYQNRIASLAVDYQQSVLPPEVVDEVNRFYDLLDSRHWRDFVSRQLDEYGSLFAPADD